MKEKDPTILEAFLSLVLLLSLCCNLRFPLAYKRESRAPHEWGRIDQPIEDGSDLDPHKNMT